MSNAGSRWFVAIISNSLLFLSSFLLLANLAPHDLFPSYTTKFEAIQALKKAENILGNLPANINIKGASESMKISNDPDSFQIIAKFIKERSPLSPDINWAQAVGVGYTALRIPVWKKTIDAFHPLYIVTMPTESPDTFNLEPVGQLSDLEVWLKESHLRALNKTAIVLLVLGFFLQLLEKVIERRDSHHRTDAITDLEIVSQPCAEAYEQPPRRLS